MKRKGVGFAVAVGILLGVSGVAHASAPAAPFPQYVTVDECGGIPTFIGSGYIVETSSGFCGLSAITGVMFSVTSGVTYLTITLPSPYTAANLGLVGAASPGGDALVPTGTGISCLDGNTFFLQTASGATLQMTNKGGCVGTRSATGTLSGAYKAVGGSATRYQLKLLTKAGGSGASWASGVSVNVLPTANLGIDGHCSVGNPGGYTNGSVFYVAFLVQHPSSGSCALAAASGPGQGQGYDLWACNLTSGGALSYSLFTGSNCGLLNAANPSNGGAMLDPHIHDGMVYVSERDNNNVLSALADSGASFYYGVWAIDQIPVTWGTLPTPGTISNYVFDDPGWRLPSGNSRASNGCEEYYKLTGFVDLPNGNVRAFFQANDVKKSASGILSNAYAGVNAQSWAGAGDSATCDGLGAGNGTDSFAFSGIFYGDLTGTAYSPSGGASITLGSNFTQLYPPLKATCLTPNNNIRCYGEFPWVFKDGVRLMFEGSLFTSASEVDLCASGVSNCQPNYTDEWIQNEISTDYSQTAFPMVLAASEPMTNTTLLGTSDCSNILSPNPSGGSNCGLWSAGQFYGGCSRMDIDEGSQTAACADQIDANEIDTANNSPFQRTMVIAYSGAAINGVTANPTALFNQAIQVLGGIQAGSPTSPFIGGISFTAQ